MTNRRALGWGAMLLFFSLLVRSDEPPRPYVLMENDLVQLKTDFNEAVDQVRLVFIVGPT